MKSRKPEDSPRDRIEEQLSLELENLYKEIEPEKIAKIEEQGGREPDLGPAYELFKVEPDASHEELKGAYEELASAWNPKRFEDHPEWKDKAEKKLEIINKAYEMILSARIREIRKKRKTIQLGEIEKEAEPSYTKEVEENEDESDEDSPRRFGLKHALIFACIPIFLLLCWFVVSPLFENPSGNKADKKPAVEKLPPLARNVQQMPVPESKPDINQETKPDKIQDQIQGQIRPEMNLNIKSEAKPDNIAPKVIETPTKPSAKTSGQKPAPAAAKPVAEAKPQAAPAAPKADTAKKAGAGLMPFSIQVGAVKDRAKGEEFIGKVRKDGYNASLVETKLPNGEKGFRILVGGFQSRDDAFAYMTTKGLQQKYPGSFVQKNTH
jgi:DedD protein